jgi:hypothetical protein
MHFYSPLTLTSVSMRDPFPEVVETAKAIRQRAQQRRKRNAEIRAALTGGSIVMAGHMLAAVYNLLAHFI